jgi:DNA processing protein
MESDELRSWLRLTLVPGVGNGTARKLLAAFGLPEAIFQQSTTALQQCVSPAQARAVLSLPEGLDALLQATLDWLAGSQRDGIARQAISLADPLYPRALLALDDPPLVLYVTGVQAIVGSRNPTPQGANNARSFAKSLAESGLHVVSGMALGIDAAAHSGALDAYEAAPCSTGSTIAIVGTGLDRVYPKQHHELAHRIASHGVILSEFPIGTPPMSANFPRRNRIISAFTQGTLVVEAALKSGSLITARLASEQGKDVFAIPGSIHSTLSKGCHALIKQGAKLVESAQDVLEELSIPIATNFVASNAVATWTTEPLELENGGHPSKPMTQVLEALGHDPVSLDALIARTGYDAATLQAYLLELELAGDAARLPGGLFQRHIQA